MNEESRWSGSRWSEPRGGSAGRGAGSDRRGPDPLEQRLDRWVSAGRQLVDGVSGARPGSRPAGRGGPARGGARSGSLPRLDNLGRWMEDKLDWLLEDGDDWREPWEQPEAGGEIRRAPAARAGDPRAGDPQPGDPRPGISGGSTPRRSARRPLEAISLRAAPAPGPAAAAEPAEDWPSDDDFNLPRWQRPSGPPPAGTRETAPGPLSPTNPAAAPRPLPRSSRRRPT